MDKNLNITKSRVCRHRPQQRRVVSLCETTPDICKEKVTQHPSHQMSIRAIVHLSDNETIAKFINH